MKHQSQQHSGVPGASAGPASASQGRSSTQQDQNSCFRPVRDSFDASTHGQRSKSSSHQHHSTHHGGRDGTSNNNQQLPDSMGHNRNAQQQRSQSHAKGQSTAHTSIREGQSAATPSNQSGANAHNSGAASRANHDGGNANAVGHYILGKALGEGTFGKVKLGTHVLTGEKVAVKVLEKSKIKDKKDVERISREIKILKQLHHPNVVQIYEIIETDKDLYLVMEFASGGELFELIVQNQKLKERTASKHLQELLAGVHYIHQLGICHRDLKPENLLIDFDGQLKIVDFGLSNMYDKGQTLKTACGSPCYAAPEMIAGNRYHGLKSDIWSCGVVLYAMLCGYLPFEDQKTSNLYKKIMNAEYSLPKFLSTDAKDILAKIFVTDPNKRIDIEGLKQHPWYRLYQPENQNFNFHTTSRTVNEKLVQKMEASLGFSTDSVQRAVENNKHNHLSATYYLLLKKYAQASFKSSQNQRIAAAPARVDSNNSKSEHHSPKKTQKAACQNSDSKNQPEGVSESEGSLKQADHGASRASTNSGKFNKFRNKGMEADRLKAPVTDQLVLKNHRREQSANATAGRHNRNGDWGSVEDERRAGSYGRPAPASDDYEIVISKVNKEANDQRVTSDSLRDSQNFNQNMRSHFASPSPEPRAARAAGQIAAGKTTSGVGVHKSGTGADSMSKPIEVTISNIKGQFSQVTTPSQVQTRGSSVPTQPLPKAATYTQATVSSSQRGAEKPKSSQQKPSSSTTATQQSNPSSNHRKTKSTALDMQKQSTLHSGNPTVPHQAEDLTAKFSQTQKIQSFSKSSEQQPRQQSIEMSTSQVLSASQTAKVSDLISNLKNQSLLKTQFDQMAAKQSPSVGRYVASKQSSAEQTAGIEGNVLGTETVVNVNKNQGSSGIFQSLTSVMQRPIIQDINSQILLKRLESGSSDNQLKQNYQSRQQQQSRRREDKPSGQTGADSQSSRVEAQDTRTLQVDSELQRMMQVQRQGSNHGTQPTSKTPVTGFHTLDSLGDLSSYELKIPVSSTDTDRGVSKSIFYGTQHISGIALTNDIQRPSNERISQLNNKQDFFSKTQTITTSQTGYQSNGYERFSKNATHRAESASRSSANPSRNSQQVRQPSRQSTSTAATGKATQENLQGSKVAINSQLRQSNNGYTIPVQPQVASTITTNAYSSVKNSQQKFQSLKSGSAAVKVTAPMAPQSSIEAQTIQCKSGMSNYAQLLQSTVVSQASKKTAKEPTQKMRSQSVSAAQKSSNIYTPSSHRKGNSSNQSNYLLQSSQGPNAAASTLTAHYRCSTASSTNKERRSSQPPHFASNPGGGNTCSQAQNFSTLLQSSSNTPVPSHKQRSSSSTNYHPAFLGKSVDGGRTDPSTRQRQKSTRDPPINEAVSQEKASHDRQFSSITHGLVNTSILSGQNDESIFSQSFNGASHNNSSTYTKRRQQVASISELLNVAETLRHNTNLFQARPRQGGLQQSEGAPFDMRLVQTNNFVSNLPQHESLQQQLSGVGSQKSQIVLSQLQQPQSLTSSQLEPRIVSQVASRQSQQQASLTTAMKQITDDLLQRQQQHYQGPPQQPSYAAQMHQSYLSDLLSKQSNGQRQVQTNQLFKKQSANPGSSLLYPQQPSANQTQQLNLKSSLYSPNGRGKNAYFNKTIEVQPDSGNLSGLQLRTPFNGKQATLEASSSTTPQALSYDHQLLQQQPNMHYSQPMHNPSKDLGTTPHFTLLQQHQQNLQQMSTGYSLQHNFMPPQQLAASMQSYAHQSAPQPQKPPSVPAPTTDYQQVLNSQYQQAINFYPLQSQHQNYM